LRYAFVFFPRCENLPDVSEHVIVAADNPPRLYVAFLLIAPGSRLNIVLTRVQQEHLEGPADRLQHELLRSHPSQIAGHGCNPVTVADAASESSVCSSASTPIRKFCRIIYTLLGRCRMLQASQEVQLVRSSMASPINEG
jgi:hypothetical protein